MILDVREISKKYGNQEVLNKVSFSIAKGEIVGFLGPNGAGKTTTMKIITGCIAPDEGRISVCGSDMLRNPVQAKGHIGYLPENNPLYDEMYVCEYLEYVAGIYKIKGEQAKSEVKKVVGQVGLKPESHKKIAQLSKGYRQRVGLAQAILHNPNLLILDEPASGLDPNQIDEFNALLQSLSKEKAILFSSHTLSEVSSVCSRIMIIRAGSIIVDKPAEEINDLQGLFKQITLSSTR